MKMAKKLLALVLTGVMAMSVLTGCGSTASSQAAGKLEGMLKKANPNATVEVGSEELANKAIGVATTDDGKFVSKSENEVKAKVVAALKAANKDEYVWYTYFKAEGKNKTDKAQAIAEKVLTRDGKAINTYVAINVFSLGGKKAGDEFVLSMKEFTVTNDDGKTTTDWIMAVVTCKPVENK